MRSSIGMDGWGEEKSREPIWCGGIVACGEGQDHIEILHSVSLDCVVEAIGVVGVVEKFVNEGADFLRGCVGRIGADAQVGGDLLDSSARGCSAAGGDEVRDINRAV